MRQKLLKKCLASTVRLPLQVLGSVAPPRHHVVEVPPFASATHPANRSRGTFFILEDGRWQLRFQCNLSASVGKSWGDVDFWQWILPKPPSTFPKQTGGWMIASFQFLATCTHGWIHLSWLICLCDLPSLNKKKLRNSSSKSFNTILLQPIFNIPPKIQNEGSIFVTLILPKKRKTAWTISTLSQCFSWHLQVTQLGLEMHRDIAVALLGAFVLAVGLGQALLQSSDLGFRSHDLMEVDFSQWFVSFRKFFVDPKSILIIIIYIYILLHFRAPSYA